MVIAGGIGQRALAIFAQNGIQVRAGQPDAPVEALVAAYLAGQLVQAPRDAHTTTTTMGTAIMATAREEGRLVLMKGLPLGLPSLCPLRKSAGLVLILKLLTSGAMWHA